MLTQIGKDVNPECNSRAAIVAAVDITAQSERMNHTNTSKVALSHHPARRRHVFPTAP
jgi:hypothetical protein